MERDEAKIKAAQRARSQNRALADLFKWGAVAKAIIHRTSIPTGAAARGDTSTETKLWRNRKRNLSTLASVSPGYEWEWVKDVKVDWKSCSDDLEGDPFVTYLTVDCALREGLSLREIRQLLEAVPEDGCWANRDSGMELPKVVSKAVREVLRG